MSDDLMRYSYVEVSPAAALRAPGARLLRLQMGLTKRSDPEPFSLDCEWQQASRDWVGRTRDQLRAHAVAQAYCEFLRQLGINPNKNPPSAMNLVQRFLLNWQPGRVRSVNQLVDWGNLASAESLVPIAMLNGDAICGALLLDVSEPGDEFLGFGMSAKEFVPPNTLILRDEEQVISLFGYRDAQATAVDADTTQLCMLACEVPHVSRELVIGALARAARYIMRSHEFCPIMD